MNPVSIQFNQTGYDPFLDFIKAFAIVSVLIGHTFPFIDKVGYCFWLGMQVPLFVLIQAFHVLKKPKAELSYKKLFFRILLPYLLVQLGVVLVYLTVGRFDNTLKIKMLMGGYGPGSYFPWVYLQLAVILYFVRPWFDKGNLIKQTIGWIVVCEGFEIVESLINIPESIHRVLAIRYLFLIYLAWIWVQRGIVIKKSTLFLSVLSLLSIAYFYYGTFNNEPLFLDTAWKFHRWPCYFYVSTLLSYMLYVIYQKTSQLLFISQVVTFLASCSYEIFLVQMGIISILPQLSFIDNVAFAHVLWIVIVWAISLGGGYLFHTIYASLLKRWQY